jgi:hypothetical protein
MRRRPRGGEQIRSDLRTGTRRGAITLALEWAAHGVAAASPRVECWRAASMEDFLGFEQLAKVLIQFNHF